MEPADPATHLNGFLIPVIFGMWGISHQMFDTLYEAHASNSNQENQSFLTSKPIRNRWGRSSKIIL
jgi:hypothetical protein